MKDTHTIRTEIRAHRIPCYLDLIALHVVEIHQAPGEPRTILTAEPLKLRQLTEDELCREQEPTLRLRPTEAQQLMDELWRTGIRPTEGAGSVGQMAAVERHLEDMRQLLAHQLKTQLPPQTR